MTKTKAIYQKLFIKTKQKLKTIYQKIIQDGSKQHIIAGETQWKIHLPTIDFKQIWKNTFQSHA